MLRLIKDQPQTALTGIVPNPRRDENAVAFRIANASSATVAAYAYCHPIRRTRKRRTFAGPSAEQVRATWF